MITYKIILKNTSKWRAYRATTLGVSVSSPNWQGDKFTSILAFAAANFLTVRIDVTDALYRHQFIAEGMDESNAINFANSLGALWLAQHADVIANCTVIPKIIRWAEWYSHEDFANTLAGFENAYETDETLQAAVHADILEFYRRRNRAPIQAEYIASKNCFIEELAIFTLQARELPSVKLYPGDELESARLIKTGTVVNAPCGLEMEQYGKVKFARRSSVENPSFQVGQSHFSQ